MGIGVFWDGLYLFLPGIAAYTDRGVFTTAYFSSLAFDPSVCSVYRGESVYSVYRGESVYSVYRGGESVSSLSSVHTLFFLLCQCGGIRVTDDRKDY